MIIVLHYKNKGINCQLVLKTVIYKRYKSVITVINLRFILTLGSI